jgi:hypothetical protein
VLDKNHPVWIIAKYLVVGGVLALMLHINYAHGFVAKDFVTVIATLASAFGVSQLHSFFSDKENK